MFLRAYDFNAAGDPVATGKLITNRDLGTDGNSAPPMTLKSAACRPGRSLKAQARDILGINLTDWDFGNVPLLATDAYGNFIPGANGFPQVMIMLGADGHFGTADDGTSLSRATRRLRIDLTHAVSTGHQFLIDIARSASPVDDFGNFLAADDGQHRSAMTAIRRPTTTSCWTRTTWPATAA